jgi:hypothetical protein
MELDALKMLYAEYKRKHSHKQNRGAAGRVDSEKSKTYQAEFAFQRRYKVKEFENLKEAQKRAKQIYATKKWQKVWKLEGRTDRNLMKQPAVVLKERNTGRGTAGWTDGWSVVLDSKAGLDEYTLLHELTHCLGHMHHGRSFRRALLELVGAFIGADAKKILKEEFAKRKLKCGKARQPLTYTQWKAARNKMENIRNV